MTSAICGITGLLVLMLAGCGGGDDASTPASSIGLAGAVDKTADFTSAVEVSQDVSFISGTSTQNNSKRSRNDRPVTG